MPELSGDLKNLAATLAGGPAFLIAGQEAEDLLGTEAINYGWSGVYTSSTDAGLAKMFDGTNRSAVPLGVGSRSHSRNQSELEVRYLFGGLHLPEQDHPAKGPVQEATARSRSTQELAHLVTETVTPHGSLMVEGWGLSDRLKPEDFLPLLVNLGAAQAHVFSSGPWSDSSLAQAFVAEGKLVLHEQSLDSSLAELAEAGALRRSSDASARESSHVVAIGSGFVDVDIHTWNQVRRSARPIDLQLLAPPVITSEQARYQEFRNFVGATEGSPRWRGLAAGMNFTRHFETELRERVQAALAEGDLPDPVIVAGQTATGKSVALASLALDLARTGEVAVLHQATRTSLPKVEDLDIYCAWAEDHGAKATVLVWDGMVEPETYASLSRQLHARGRKVLIVGSSYKQKEGSDTRQRQQGAWTLEAPALLEKSETRSLAHLLEGFGVNVQVPSDSSFLAFLYRVLPETEYKLRAGLTGELRYAERAMAQLSQSRQENASEDQRLTAIQRAFQAAGKPLEELLLPTDAAETVGEQTFAERAPIQRVTTLVLVAARHGMPVPMDLALRVLGREGSQNIRDALTSTDIIREIDDDSGEFFLGARSQLEAELIAREEIPHEVEVEVILEAIRHVRLTDSYVAGADEVDFIVKLLERIGPRTTNEARFRRNFRDFADALRQRREESNFPNPRLVLQESKLVRSWSRFVQDQDVDGSAASAAQSELEHNRETLESALYDTAVHGPLRSALAVELASTLGAAIVQQTHEEDTGVGGDFSILLDDVLEAVLEARNADPGNLHPVDVLAWATRDAVNSGRMEPNERVEAIASAIAALESTDRSTLNETQLAKVDGRSAELGKLLGNDSEAWEYLQRLEENSSAAATFFLARFEADSGPAGLKAALSRLRDAPASIRSDWRCAQLLIDLTWQEITGQPLRLGQRTLLHLSPASVERVRRLSQDISDADLPDPHRFLFARAVTEFIAGNYEDSRRLFRNVGDMTRQVSRRIYSSYILGDGEGLPLSFTGRVERSTGARGSVWVNELGTRVSFNPRHFARDLDLAQGQRLPPFHIAFTLSSGPVAEPRSFFRGSARR